MTALCLDVSTADPPHVVRAARDRLAVHGLPLRCRLPEVLFDGDAGWLEAVLGCGWDAVIVRHLGALETVARRGLPFVLEYPLQGLNALTAAVAAGLAGRAPAAVVASPEASLPEIAALAAGVSASPDAGASGAGPVLEVVAFGRQQLLRTRDQLGRAEGLYDAPGPAGHVGLLLRDARDYVFPTEVDASGTRLYNARVTNLAGHLDELRAAGAGAFWVVQADMDPAERAAFATGGLPGLAVFTARQRFTTGHLFRGVA